MTADHLSAASGLRARRGPTPPSAAAFVPEFVSTPGRAEGLLSRFMVVLDLFDAQRLALALTRVPYQGDLEAEHFGLRAQILVSVIPFRLEGAQRHFGEQVTRCIGPASIWET